MFLVGVSIQCLGFERAVYRRQPLNGQVPTLTVLGILPRQSVPAGINMVVRAADRPQASFHSAFVAQLSRTSMHTTSFTLAALSVLLVAQQTAAVCAPGQIGTLFVLCSAESAC